MWEMKVHVEMIAHVETAASAVPPSEARRRLPHCHRPETPRKSIAFIV